MTEPKPKIGFFRHARNRPQRGFLVEIDVSDIRKVRPDWDDQQATAFLQQHGQRIANHMLEAGMTAVIALVIGSDYAN